MIGKSKIKGAGPATISGGSASSWRKSLAEAFFVCMLTSSLFSQIAPTPQNLPFAVDFGSTGFTNLPAGIAVWNGVSGGNTSTQTSAENSTPIGNATLANATNTQTTGGAYGYASGGNAKLYIQTSSNATNGANQPVFAINTTGASDISFSYTVDVISAQQRTIGVVAQYRVGTNGAWTNIAATSGSNPFSQAGGTTGPKTTVTASLPSAANNQPVVQIRWAIWRGTEAGNSSGIAIDNISVAAPASPTISISGSFVPFNTLAGTASAAQSFTVTGTSLTSPISVSAPTGFEVSADNQVTYSSSTNIPQSGGAASNAVLVRLSATNAQGTYSGNIALASTGAATNSVAVSGTVQATGQIPIITATDLSGTVGILFSNSITASGLPTSYAIAEGTLPGGLALNTTNGSITGTPSEAVSNRVVSVIASNGTGASAPADVAFTIAKGSQTITNFTGLADRIVGSESFNLAAGANSGLAVSYASGNSAVASVSGSRISVVGIGTTVITVSQAGDSNWDPASSSQILKVTSAPLAAWDFNGEANPTNSFADLHDSNLDSSGVLARGSNAPPNSANNTFRTLGFKNDGISTTNTDYFEFQLSAKAGYSLSLSSIDARFDGTSTFYAAAGVTMQFAYSTNGSAFVLIGLPKTLTNTGSISAVDLSGVAALQNLAPATTVTFRYYASGATDTGGWGFQSPAVGQYGLAVGGILTAVSPPVITSLLTASGKTGEAFNYAITSSGSAATYTASPLPSGLSLNGAVISGNLNATPGTYNITVTASNASGSDSKTVVLTVDSAGQSQPQTIAFGTIANKTYGDAAFALTASASSGLPVIYTSSNTNVANVTNGSVTIRSAGSTVLTASQAGDGAYLPASSVSQTLVVGPKTLAVTGLVALDKVYDGTPLASLGGNATASGTVEGDFIVVSGGRGIFSDASAGAGRTVTVSDLQLSGIGASNYTVGPVTGLTANILPRPVVVTANAASKSTEEIDPPVTYSVYGLVETNGLSGSLVRVAGTNSGIYPIQQGTLASSANYTLTYVSNNLTIMRPYLPPGNYYSNAVGKISTDLKSALNGIIRAGFRSISYGTGSSTGISGVVPVMKLLYEDPANTNNLILIYGGDSFPKASFGTSGSSVWNREHTWPQSFGADAGYAQSDLFHMYPARGDVNSDRNNDVYGHVTNDNGAKTAPACRETEGVTWEPPDSEKGAVARGILYMAVRYEGGSSDGGTADLELIDGAGDTTSGSNQFGQLSDLLAWNRTFPPTEREKWKNNEIYTKYQFNRNPFIDNPDYAEMVFRGTPSVAVAMGQNAAEAGLVAGKITLKRLGTTSASLTVNFSWSGSATPGTDTLSLPSYAIFPIGVDTMDVSVIPKADTEIEATEVLTLNLSSSTHYVSSQGAATVQIADDPIATAKSDQTISFPALGGPFTYGDGAVELTATASSGLPVTYTSSNTNIGRVNGNTLNFYAAGTITLTANQSGNNTFASAIPSNQTVTIGPRNLTISGISAESKFYDRTATAVVSGTPILSGLLPGDSVTLGSAAATFTDYFAGSSRAVLTGYILTGPQAGNYVLTQPTGLTATIKPSPLQVTGATVQNKPYDGNNLATLIGGRLIGVLGEDDVALATNSSATFASSLVGTWSVTASFSVAGTDRNNYQLTQPTSLSGSIFDNVQPAITLTGDNPLSLAVGTSFADPGASAFDAVDGIIPVRASGTVDTSTRGVYTITYSAVDTAGNSAYATRTVNVRSRAEYILGAIYGLSGTDARLNADADKDGVVNLMEYAFGADPSLPSNAPASPAASFATGALRMTAVVRDDDNQLGFTAKAAADLVSAWTTNNVREVIGVDQRDVPSGFCRRAWEAMETNQATQFIRLEVSYP